jgi:hypothetical protein
VSEKTEQPTAKKLREARKQGQFARSRLLSSAVATLGGLLGFLAFADASGARIKTWAAQLFPDPSRAPATALTEAVTLFALAVASPFPTRAAAQDQDPASAMRWRAIGPTRAGRAAQGDPLRASCYEPAASTSAITAPSGSWLCVS